MVEADRSISESDRLVKERKFAEAKELLEKSRRQVKEVLGEQDPLYGTIANRLGHRYRAEREYDKAEAMYREDLAIREKHGGKEHPNYATALLTLGEVAAARNDFAAAEKLHREALDLRRKARGPRHADTLDSLTRLAALYQKWAGRRSAAGDYAAAAENYCQALDCVQTQYGATNSRTTNARLTLAQAEREANLDDAHHKQLDEAARCRSEGDALFRQGKYRSAGESYQKAADLRAAALGEDDRLTIAAQFALADSYAYDGDHREAERRYRIVLDWRKKTLGELHPDTAATLERLGRLHFIWLNNYAAAERELAECLKIRATTLGTRHEQYAVALKNMARFALSTGQFARAEDLGRKAVETLREASGETTSYFGDAAWILGEIYHSLGDYAQAEPLLQKAILAFRKSHGERHPYVADATIKLGTLYDDIGDHAGAAAAYREAYAIQREVFGEGDPKTAYAIALLGNVARKRGNLEEAEKLYRKAMDLRSKAYGNRSSQYALCLSDLALVHRARHEYDKAEKLEKEAFEIRKAVYGVESLILRGTC